MSYKQLSIEEYLETPKIKDLPQETKEEIRRVRSTYEYMSFDQFTMLHTTLRIVKRTIKLKYPRSLWVCPESKIWFFDHYHKEWKYCGYFFDEAYIAERDERERLEREAIEANRAKKKAEKAEKRRLQQEADKALNDRIKALKQELTVKEKPKRPRIKK